ncbi:MAG: transposase [Lachnospiraceae bacterium]|nr:transposase [Lachnospiraceae bacterium]
MLCLCRARHICDPKTVGKYIDRYLGRPVIATSRIVNYDGENVTFHYNRHEDDAYVEETLAAMDFIKCLSGTSLKNTLK